MKGNFVIVVVLMLFMGIFTLAQPFIRLGDSVLTLSLWGSDLNGQLFLAILSLAAVGASIKKRGSKRKSADYGS